MGNVRRRNSHPSKFRYDPALCKETYQIESIAETVQGVARVETNSANLYIKPKEKLLNRTGITYSSNTYNILTFL